MKPHIASLEGRPLHPETSAGWTLADILATDAEMRGPGRHDRLVGLLYCTAVPQRWTALAKSVRDGGAAKPTNMLQIVPSKSRKRYRLRRVMRLRALMSHTRARRVHVLSNYRRVSSTYRDRWSPRAVGSNAVEQGDPLDRVRPKKPAKARVTCGLMAPCSAGERRPTGYFALPHEHAASRSGSLRSFRLRMIRRDPPARDAARSTWVPETAPEASQIARTFSACGPFGP